MEKPINLHENALFYDNVLDLIPSQYYFHEEQEPVFKSKYMKKPANSEKQQHKLIQKQEKKNRFQFDKEKSMAELQKEKIQNANEESKERKTQIAKIIPTAIPVIESKPAGTLSELRSRLDAKREHLMLQRQKKPETENKKRKGNSQAYLERHMKNQEKQDTDNNEIKPKDTVSNQTKSISNTTQDLLPKTITPDISDVLSNVQFGKFVEQEDFSLKPKMIKSKKQQLTKLLEKTQAKKKRLEELKQTEEGEKLAEDIKWDPVLKKADGIKVKDNEALIHKSLKKIDDKKKKSEQNWKARVQKQKQDKKLAEKHKRAGFEGRKQGFLNKQKNNKDNNTNNNKSNNHKESKKE